MKKIVLNSDQFTVLGKKLERFKVEQSFLQKALALRKGSLPKIESSETSYEGARASWRSSAQGSNKERVALVAMIRFALAEQENTEKLLLDACDLAMRSIDELAKMLVIRAIAETILKKEESVLAYA